MLEALLVGAGKRATGLVRAMGEVGIRVAVVVEPDADRRAALVASEGVPHAYPDLAAVPPSAHGVRCAFVVTPPWLHADAFVRCVELGLPVFCEKPMDMDLAAAERMLRAALRAGVPTMFGFNRRYTPVGRLARALAADARPCFVHTSKSRPMTYSRMLAENAVHAVDLLLCLAGSVPDAVRAVGSFKDPQIEAEAFVAAVVRFVAGGAGSVQMVTTGHGSVERLEVYADGWTLRGDLGGAIRYQGPPERLAEAAARAGVELEARGDGSHAVRGRSDLAAELEAFARVAQGAREEVPDAVAAFEAQRLVEEIYRQAGLPPTRWAPSWVREA